MNRLFRRNCQAPGYSDLGNELDTLERRERMRRYATWCFAAGTVASLVAVVHAPGSALTWTILALSVGTLLDRL